MRKIEVYAFLIASEGGAPEASEASKNLKESSQGPIFQKIFINYARIFDFPEANLRMPQGKLHRFLETLVNLKGTKKLSGNTLRVSVKKQVRFEVFEKKVGFT